MSSGPADPRRFYLEALPAQWNAALREQERAVEAAQRLLDGMRDVDATIRVDVEGEGGGTFFLKLRIRPGASEASGGGGRPRKWATARCMNFEVRWAWEVLGPMPCRENSTMSAPGPAASTMAPTARSTAW